MILILSPAIPLSRCKPRASGDDPARANLRRAKAA